MTSILPNVPIYENTWAHAVLGLLILVVSGRLGRLLSTYRSDYQPIASLFDFERSTGFNAIYRILFAPLSIVVASIVLFLVGGDYYVANIWAASVWFFLLQTLMLIALVRWRLVDKRKYFVFHGMSIALSVYLYFQLIQKGIDSLLPDEANLRTDLWLIVALFLYGIYRSIPENQRLSDRRKAHYAFSRAKKFQRKYRVELQPYDESLRRAILAIMVYEDFNRPKLARWLEHMTDARTQSILQLRGVNDDATAITQTAQRLRPFLDKYVELQDKPIYEREQALAAAFSTHNPGDYSYREEVLRIFRWIE